MENLSSGMYERESRATGQTNEKQLDRTSNILWSRQKIVYLSAMQKTSKTVFARGRIQLPI